MRRVAGLMPVDDDYLTLRRLQKEAREEMWHVFSHHLELKAEWKRDNGGCFRALRDLVDWEPED